MPTALRPRRALTGVAAALIGLAAPALAVDPEVLPGSEQTPAPAKPVPPEPGEPDTDLVEVLAKATGLYKQPTEEDLAREKRKRFHWNIIPFILTSPLIDFGVGVAAAGVFHLGDDSTRLSKFATHALVTVKSQVSVPLRTTIFFPGNDWSMVGYANWRKFPSPTWGVGGNTPNSAELVVDYSLFRLNQILYRRIFERLYAGVGWNFDDFYRIASSGSAGSPTTPFTSYPWGTQPYFNSGPSLSLLYDSRDNPVNAHQGTYANLTFRALPTWLGSSTSWQSLYMDFKHFLELAKPNVLAFWAYAWFGFGDVPYLDLPSIGSDPDARSGRGYTEGRHISKGLLYAEVEYRFHIWSILGGAAGINVHSASQPGTGYAVTANFRYWYPAATAGLRVLINKESRANGLLEFGLGLDGSWGIYLNINENF